MNTATVEQPTLRTHGQKNVISREEAVAYALSWKGTPFVQDGRVRGAGCDCRTIIEAYLLGIGVADEIVTERYPMDWFHHSKTEDYFNKLSKYVKCVWEGGCSGTPPALSGDIALFRIGDSKLYNHGCIITKWPQAIHAFNRSKGVGESRVTLHYMTAHRPMAIFDPWSQ